MDAAVSFWATPGGWTLITLGQVLLITVCVLLAVAFLLLADRKVWASVQMRKGPNVVGPFGLLQSFADMLKFVLKEIVIPAGADKAVFILAPLSAVVLAFVGLGRYAVRARLGRVEPQCRHPVPAGDESLGVYGIIMGGWASNSKYPFLGSLRSAAQMVSYEVSIGLIIITVILLAGSMNLSTIVESSRAGSGTGTSSAAGRSTWSLLLDHGRPMGMFYISALAETNRPPFDLPEAESELVAGYQVEYSSTPYLLFMVAEYSNIVLMCAMISVLFFGGWNLGIPVDLVAMWGWWGKFALALVFYAKICFWFFMIAMAKAIVPRYRYDQLMRLGWKVFLPTSLVLVAAVAAWRVFGPGA
jgi:NADH-quinone oxidoreductase subunit H